MAHAENWACSIRGADEFPYYVCIPAMNGGVLSGAGMTFAQAARNALYGLRNGRSPADALNEIDANTPEPTGPVARHIREMICKALKEDA